MPANSGAPGSAGTRDIKVIRITEQPAQAALATVENPTANPPTINALDNAGASGGEGLQLVGVIDTTETSRLTPSQLIKRGRPAAW